MNAFEKQIQDFYNLTEYEPDNVIVHAMLYTGAAAAMTSLINFMSNVEADDPPKEVGALLVKLGTHIRESTHLAFIDGQEENPFKNLLPLVKTFRIEEQQTLIGVLYAGMSSFLVSLVTAEDINDAPAIAAFCSQMSRIVAEEGQKNNLSIQGFTALAEMPLDEAMSAS